MKILFVTTAHNSLSQRLYVELVDVGHMVNVVLAADDSTVLSAVARERPDLIIAPMLKSAIPEAIWRRHTCLIVHPGIRGDRGPSSLDWAISDGEANWGVTILQADAEMDAGPIWAWREFAMPEQSCPKSRLYRKHVTEAAVSGVLAAVEKFSSGSLTPETLDYDRREVRGTLRPLMKQGDRTINWKEDTTAVVARKIRAADSSPGVLSTQWAEPYLLFGAHEEGAIRGKCGEILAVRDGAICVGTTDGAIWITHLKAKQEGAIKLPATQVLGQRIAKIPEAPIDPFVSVSHCTWREIYYVERNHVGYLHFDFYNGAMSTHQCRRLRDAYLAARTQPTKVIVLMGGSDFFSNGIHLNTIEAAENPAIESWHNILAIDDLVAEIINTMSHTTVAALRGNAGAGGAMMALAADQVYARAGAILNPHYKTMGGLYGSEYWTYTLPRRVGPTMANNLIQSCQPLGTWAAKNIGFIDEVLDIDAQAFERELTWHCEAIASSAGFWNRLKAKHAHRLADECIKPLAAYRQEELARMQIDFFGAESDYHQARQRFVHKQKPSAGIFTQNRSPQPWSKSAGV
jgi:putative two-component system protein, hydrogenase maturation factor HypX/HoxX